MKKLWLERFKNWKNNNFNQFQINSVYKRDAMFCGETSPGDVHST
jgi:hypothetical protein